MGFIRRALSVTFGLVAGIFAYKIIKDYNDKSQIEGEFIELPLAEQAASNEPQQVHVPTAVDTGPNANPVTLGTAEKPFMADGRLDATRIASPEDFADWSSSGCQG